MANEKGRSGKLRGANSPTKQLRRINKYLLLIQYCILEIGLAHLYANLPILKLDHKTITLYPLFLIKNIRDCLFYTQCHLQLKCKHFLFLGKPRKIQHSGSLQKHIFERWPQNSLICLFRCTELII